jgi:hypothetical protein
MRVVIPCLPVVILLLGTVLIVFAGSTSIVLQAPSSAAVDCVKDALKENDYRLAPSTAPSDSGPKLALIGVRGLSPEHVRRYALGLPKSRNVQIRFGLCKMRITLIPVDYRSTQVDLSADIVVFMEPGLPLMRPSRLFRLSSSGDLEADLVASLKRSACAFASSASSPDLRY